MAQSTLPTLGSSNNQLFTGMPVSSTPITDLPSAPVDFKIDPIERGGTEIGSSFGAQPQPTNSMQTNGATTQAPAQPATQPAFQPQTASTATFDPSTQTVQGQIKGIIDANSPLMQQAETRANQQMNGRGLINSSMGVGAAQAALYDAAMPIAASDAQAYNQNQQFNVGQENQFKNASNSQGFDLAKMQETQRNQTAQLQQKFGYDKELTNMQSTSAKETAEIGAKYKNLTQASASAASLMNNASDHIHQIMMNENLDAAGKQAAINAYNANLNKALQLTGAFAGDVDLSTMLDELLGDGTQDAASSANNTAPAFDAAAYLAANSDVAADPWFSQHPEDHYMIFRPATLADADLIVALVERMVYGTAIAMPNPAKVQRIIAKNYLECVFDGDVLSGFMAGHVGETFLNSEVNAYDNGLFIAPEYRGGSAAVKLLRTLKHGQKPKALKMFGSASQLDRTKKKHFTFLNA
jgi:hypothetical protein